MEDVNDTPLLNVDVDVLFEFIDYNDGNTVDIVNDTYRRDCTVNRKAFKKTSRIGLEAFAHGIHKFN